LTQTEQEFVNLKPEITNAQLNRHKSVSIQHYFEEKYHTRSSEMTFDRPHSILQLAK